MLNLNSKQLSTPSINLKPAKAWFDLIFMQDSSHLETKNYAVYIALYNLFIFLN